MNDEKKFGGPAHKNDKSEKIFAELTEGSKELSMVSIIQKISRKKCINFRS